MSTAPEPRSGDRMMFPEVREVLGAPSVGPLPAGPFDVIYADPPWRYSSATTTPSRAIEAQYPTMALPDICDLPVARCAAKNAILFLWATNPLLPECMTVLPAWGFTYKTSMVWVKDRIGLGHWVRGQHEPLLIATRGKPALPKSKPSSVIEAPRGLHSAKPEAARRRVETMFPDARRLEMFARERIVGWDAWGYDA